MVDTSHVNPSPESLLIFFFFFLRFFIQQQRSFYSSGIRAPYIKLPSKWFCCTIILMLWLLFHAEIYEGLQQNLTVFFLGNAVIWISAVGMEDNRVLFPL